MSCEEPEPETWTYTVCKNGLHTHAHSMLLARVMLTGLLFLDANTVQAVNTTSLSLCVCLVLVEFYQIPDTVHMHTHKQPATFPFTWPQLHSDNRLNENSCREIHPERTSPFISDELHHFLIHLNCDSSSLQSTQKYFSGNLMFITSFSVYFVNLVNSFMKPRSQTARQQLFTSADIQRFSFHPVSHVCCSSSSKHGVVGGNHHCYWCS